MRSPVAAPRRNASVCSAATVADGSIGTMILPLTPPKLTAMRTLSGAVGSDTLSHVVSDMLGCNGLCLVFGLGMTIQVYDEFS